MTNRDDLYTESRQPPTRRSLRTFIAHVEDRPGVLNRVVSLFRRRGYNIDSLTVGRTHRPGVSRITVIMEADDDNARRIEANLYKLVNVLHVADVTPEAAVAREMALIKVRAEPRARPELLQLCEVFRARVVDVAPETITVEITGTRDKLDGLLEVLRAYEIVEMVRTGAVAMARGAGRDLSELTNTRPRAADEIGSGDDCTSV